MLQTQTRTAQATVFRRIDATRGTQRGGAFLFNEAGVDVGKLHGAARCCLHPTSGGSGGLVGLAIALFFVAGTAATFVEIS